MASRLLALALHQQERTAEAHAWFERHPRRLRTTESLVRGVDVRQRQLRGNIPQAFVHALLLESATRLSRPWQDESA